MPRWWQRSPGALIRLLITEHIPDLHIGLNLLSRIVVDGNCTLNIRTTSEQTSEPEINIFSLNLILTPGLVITAQGIDSQQVVHQLPVEFVGNVPGFNPVVPQEPFLTHIVLRLPDGITNASDLQVRITARGRKQQPGADCR